MAFLLQHSIPGPFQLELVAEWIESINEHKANQLALSKSKRNLSRHNNDSDNDSDSENPNTITNTIHNLNKTAVSAIVDTLSAALPKFMAEPILTSVPSTVLALPKMPAPVSRGYSRRTGELVRDHSLDLSLERR